MKLGTARRPGSIGAGPHKAAVTSHHESALMWGVLKESPESTVKAIRVCLILHLGVDLGSDYLLIGRTSSKA